MKTLALIVALSSLALAKECPKNHIDGPAGPCSAYMPPALGASADESAKWVSDETAPGKGHQPAWETGAEKTIDAPNMSASDRKTDEFNAKEIESASPRPKSCISGCKWDGITCTCENDKSKVQFDATATTVEDSTAGKLPQ